MRLDISPPANAYDVVTKRWGLQNARQILQTYRSTVYRVESPHGPAKLKLYTQIGYRGERAAISFSKGSDSKAIAQIYQSDFYRAAVLSEWIDGPTVGDTRRKGDYETATRLACDVIRGLTENSSVRFPFAYRRKTANRFRLMQRQLKNTQSPERKALLVEAMGILERLLALRSTERVIHGDLHYDNMIQTPQGARAIDPRGVKAHPIVNCESLFSNTGPDLDLSAFAQVFSDQVKIITENLGYDRDLLMHYALLAWLGELIDIDESNQPLREKRLGEVEMIRAAIARN
ncbi:MULTISPECIES: aminoglycoside phosphotransferase family protein [unclassified Yoonia]|uniref:aminoglycoside phosphotransferase family protein n=1 Tax=unclassified Yoonia TaxID=2629118 RepID=UPI002AFF0D58|nr:MULTISPECIES: aminoglycoside phosphotransferase family protein [unclassified Yoonia]